LSRRLDDLDKLDQRLWGLLDQRLWGLLDQRLWGPLDQRYQ